MLHLFLTALHYFGQVCANTSFQATVLGSATPIAYHELVREGISISRKQKVGIAIGICVFMAFIPIVEKAATTGFASTDDFVKSFGVCFSAAKILYEMYFKAKFEEATPPSA